MKNVWAKSMLQAIVFVTIIFFALFFLSLSGIRYFSEEVFTLGGFLVLVFYVASNVFGNINWK